MAKPEESGFAVLNVVKNHIGDRHKILRFAQDDKTDAQDDTLKDVRS